MVKEYHNKFLHVVADCKTGNAGDDKGIENVIIGYTYLVLHAFEVGKMNELIDKTRDIATGFSASTVDARKENKCKHDNVLEIYKDGNHKDISHYRCVQCGEKKEVPFGNNIVKSNRSTTAP